MIRTQILLPDELHDRIKRFATERELSVTEVARRAMENWLDRFPEKTGKEWKLPVIDGGEIKVPLEDLRKFAADDEAVRSLSK